MKLIPVVNFTKVLLLVDPKSVNNVVKSERSWVRSLSNPMLDGSGVKAMPGSIPTPNSGSRKIRKYR